MVRVVPEINSRDKVLTDSKAKIDKVPEIKVKAMENNVLLKDKAKVKADKVAKTMVVRAREVNSKAKVPTDNKVKVVLKANKVPEDRADRIKIKVVLKMADNPLQQINLKIL